MDRRAILQSDINCRYAQIKCQAHPELRDKPVVVDGGITSLAISGYRRFESAWGTIKTAGQVIFLT